MQAVRTFALRAFLLLAIAGPIVMIWWFNSTPNVD